MSIRGESAIGRNSANGLRSKNFLLMILRLATEKEELRIVHDQVGAPTWSRKIAAAMARVLTEISRDGANLSAAFSKVSGTYHLTAAGETNRYEFTEKIFEEARRMTQSPSWFPMPPPDGHW